MSHPILDMVPSVSIANLLSQRDAIVSRLRQMHALEAEIETLCTSAFSQASYNRANPSLYDRRTNTYLSTGLEDMIKGVDATAWDHLLTASGLRTFMDAAARKQWDDDIGAGKVVELTEENIASTFSALYDSRGAMFEEGVINVFKSLSWSYKTNQPCRFGKRIIMRYCVEVWGGGVKYTTGLKYEAGNKLDDLVRVLLVLDGKPEPDSRQSARHILNEMRWMRDDGTVNLATLHEVISIRGFKNGNGHITFLRLDLVDKMNQILAKHYPNALPPAEE